jgi:hypothetical protein
MMIHPCKTRVIFVSESRGKNIPYKVQPAKLGKKFPAWRDFKIRKFRPLFTIFFRPKMVDLDTDSILIRSAMVE